MNTSKIVFILVLSCFYFTAFSQSWEEIKKPGSAYIWGEGIGSILQEADKNALDDLATQISVQVSSSFEQMVVETGSDVNHFVKSVIETYSSVTLNNTLRLVDEKKQVRVLRYILKKDVSKIFENRRQKVIDFTRKGLDFEEENKIDFALRYYYWALVLLRSHPENNTIRHPDEDFSDGLLIHALSDRLQEVMRNVVVQVSGVNENPEEKHSEVILNISYKGKPVESFEYTYYTGTDWERPVTITGARGVADFFGDGHDKIERLHMRIEYQFIHQSRNDEELRSVMSNPQWLPRFSESDKFIPLLRRKSTAPEIARPEMNIKALNEVGSYREMQQSVAKVVQAVATKSQTEVRDLFTDEGYKIFMLLTSNGRVKVLEIPDTLSMIRLNNETIVRSVPMSFSFQNNNCTFTEHVVFAFDETGKISSLSFALGRRAITDIMEKGERFGTTEDRYHIIRFMEDYKTAYSLKRLDFIESIFDENALIIVGRILQNDPNPGVEGMYRQLGERVEYIRMEKREYVDRLKMVFAGNEFVNIQFEENEVKRAGTSEKIYGIQISQNYHSSNYADKGYLFLMINLEDSLNPRIYVRSWQPEKFPDGSVIGLSDFYF